MRSSQVYGGSFLTLIGEEREPHKRKWQFQDVKSDF